VSWYLFITP